jgi:hypothetical protein
MSLKTVILAASLIQSSCLLCGATILVNGDFETGDLTGWSTFVTPNGDIGAAYGLPNVVPFDVTGSGTASDAAQFEVGELAFLGSHTAQGGGIFQNFTCFPGQYVVSLDVAAQNINSFINAQAGTFNLFVDGSLLASTNYGQISPGQVPRAVLSATTEMGPGTHQIMVEITRSWLTGGFGETPLEYLDNIAVAPVPEPSQVALGILGLILMLAHRRINPKFRA